MVTFDGDEEFSEAESTSSSSSDSEARIDSVIDNIIANLSLYTPVDNQPNMTIKNKSKKERNKHEREREAVDRPGTSSANCFSYPYPSFHFTAADGIRQPAPIPPINDNPEYEPETAPYSHTHNPLTHSHKRRIYNPTAGHEKPPKKTCDRRPAQTVGSVLPHKIQGQEDTNGSGNNSEDEYYHPSSNTYTNSVKEDEAEKELERLLTEKKGWQIVRVGMDGACLFRAVSLHIFGDEDRHDIIRSQVLDYMCKNKEHFSQYVTEDFDRYVARKREPTCHGNHLEIQAMSELYNRPVEIYHDTAEPINVFHSEYQAEAPIRLSYHGHVHYNSVIDPFNPCIGYGLGMPNYQPKLPEPDLIEQAVAESETFQLEHAMLHDKIKETEKQEIDRVIEEQVARESYLEYFSQFKTRRSGGKSRVPSPLHPGGACATTSSTSSRPLHSRSSPKKPDTEEDAPSSQPGSPVASVSGAVLMASAAGERSVSPVGACADGTSSLHGAAGGSSSQSDFAILRHIPPHMFDMDESTMMALVMEESRREYITSLKSKTNPSSSAPPETTSEIGSEVPQTSVQSASDNDRPGCSKDS